MSARLVYLRLELKRACKKLPHIFAGAIVLLLLAGTIALLSARMLYGETSSGRITVGVVLPEGDAVAKKALAMVSSLESVKSICDFEYMNKEECLDKLNAGKLYAVMEVPEGFVQDIMNGTNTPVKILLPRGTGLESRIFKELTDAGASTLGAGQAGIYAGDELLYLYDMADSVSGLEADLNRIYMGYSLPRMDYFKNVRVSATGDVDTIYFYGISTAVLFLLLSAIPVSAYLASGSASMKGQLALIGVGKGTLIAVRVLGLGMLFLAVALCTALGASFAGLIELNLPGLAALVMVCLGAASMVVFIYQAAGSLMGGVMLLFLAVTAMHFLSGGFLPLVFLPATFRAAAPFLPNYMLMEGMKLVVTSSFSLAVLMKLAALALAGFLLSVGAEVVRE